MAAEVALAYQASSATAPSNSRSIATSWFFLARRSARTATQKQTHIRIRFYDARMPGAIAVIGRAQMRTCHDTLVAFLRDVGCAIRRVSVSLSEIASGEAIEEKSWSSP